MTNAVEGACLENNLDLHQITTVAATALRDVVLRLGDQLLGMECKRTDTPRLTRSIRIAIEDLRLKRVALVYPGEKRFPLSRDEPYRSISSLCRMNLHR
jgi:hypothetical protein